MHRRIWIKQIVTLGGGILLLPACKSDEGATSVVLKNISVTRKQENYLAEIGEAIIPATNTPGAKALNLHQFVLKMIDDCYDQNDQNKFLKGFSQFNSYAEEIAKDSFFNLDQQQKLNVLRSVRDDKKASEELKFFVAQTRKWIIKGYDSSEYVLTKLAPYELVPGRFYGCQPVTKTLQHG